MQSPRVRLCQSTEEEGEGSARARGGGALEALRAGLIRPYKVFWKDLIRP